MAVRVLHVATRPESPVHSRRPRLHVRNTLGHYSHHHVLPATTETGTAIWWHRPAYLRVQFAYSLSTDRRPKAVRFISPSNHNLDGPDDHGLHSFRTLGVAAPSTPVISRY